MLFWLRILDDLGIIVDEHFTGSVGSQFMKSVKKKFNSKDITKSQLKQFCEECQSSMFTCDLGKNIRSFVPYIFGVQMPDPKNARFL